MTAVVMMIMMEAMVLMMMMTAVGPIASQVVMRKMERRQLVA
jgi:hypothetical protein